MRPSAIRVFDGLRVTTEHVEHLQAALDTAVRDLREIVGIGQVHRGFEVRATGPATLEVGPGLAFDLLGNRIIADERQTLAVSFTEGGPDPLVCIRHEQVETGEVEGVQTLVFDSSSVFLASEPPSPEALAIVVARLARSDAGGDPPAFDVVDLRWPEAPAAPAEPEPRPENAVQPETGAGGSAPIRETPLRVARGLVQLSPATDALMSLADLAPDGRLPLGEATVAMPFEPSLLSADVLLSAHWELRPAGEASESEAGAARALTMTASARGEATFDADGIDQHGLTEVHVSYATDQEAATAWAASLLAEGQLAGLDLERLLADAPVLELGPAGEALADLELALEAARTPEALVLRCWLGWKGAVDSELLDVLVAAAPTFGWTAHVAWRGVGTGPPSVEVQPAGGA